MTRRNLRQPECRKIAGLQLKNRCEALADTKDRRQPDLDNANAKWELVNITLIQTRLPKNEAKEEKATDPSRHSASNR